MASGPTPLWDDLRAALEERGYSVRGFAKACFEADQRMSWASWKRTINRALDEDAVKPYTPSLETAELWARLLKKPRQFFFRPQDRESIQEVREERDQLRVEVERLRAELARQRARSRSSR